MENLYLIRRRARGLLAMLSLLLISLAPAQVSIQSITFASPSIHFHRLQTVRLNLSGPAPAGTVAKVFDDSPYISFPRDVPVPEGASFVDFKVYAGGYEFYTGTLSYPVNVVASILGTVPATNSFEILPSQKWRFYGGGHVYGGDTFGGVVAVTWDYGYPDYIRIHFGDDSPLVSSPAPIGLVYDFFEYESWVNVLYHSYPVAAPTTVTLWASSDGFRYSTSVTLYPRPVLTAINMNPATVVGGSSTVGTAQVSFPGDGGPIEVTLTSNSISASVPPSCSIPTGQSQSSFNITTLPVTSIQVVTIRGRYHGVIRTGRITVLPGG